MADITEAQAIATRDEWIAAERKLSEPGVQSYSMGEVSVSRADMDTIKMRIAFWSRICDDFAVRAAAASGDYAHNNPHVAVARVR